MIVRTKVIVDIDKTSRVVCHWDNLWENLKKVSFGKEHIVIYDGMKGGYMRYRMEAR